MNLSFRRLRIGPRLTLCFTLILALAVAGGWTAATASRASRARMLETVAQSSRLLADLAEVRIALEREDRLAQRLALATDIDAAHVDMNEIDARAAACRLATQRLAAALTTRGFKEPQILKVADIIDRVFRSKGDANTLAKAKADVAALCAQFPMKH